MPILFLLFWIILNSRITLEVGGIGVFVSALMAVFVYRLIGLSFKEEWQIWKQAAALFRYLLALLVEIIKANLQMIRII